MKKRNRKDEKEEYQKEFCVLWQDRTQEQKKGLCLKIKNDDIWDQSK